MRTTRDVVLVSTPSKYNNQIEIAGGKVLWLDTSYKPLHHVSISGKVEAVPGLLSPRHYGHGKSTMDLEVGDKVYFNYLTIDPENLMPYGDEEFYRVDYFNVFCYIRGGILNMTNSWVFVEPMDNEKGAEYGESKLIIPEAYRNEPNYKVGKLRHIGKPLRGAPTLDAKPGDYVIYEKDSDFANEIEGEVFYTMKQDNLLAIVPQKCLEKIE